MVSIIAKSLVFISTLILIASLLTVRQIYQQLPLGRSRLSWYAMVALISLFIIGYLGYITAFWNRHTSLLDLIVPGIFFGGACFVWLSTILSLQTARDVLRITLLERETLTDPLTGAYNRRYMDQRLREETAKARRYGFELALLLLDLDHFKRINDEHGHQAGDQALVDIADIINRELRNSDIFARYGGEELIIIAPNTDALAARNLAQRLRTSIASHQFHAPLQDNASDSFQLTASFGIANYGSSINSEEILIHTADENLYRAKHQGRNRVVDSLPDD